MPIESVIRLIPEWKDKTISVTSLSGGLTNENYLVRVDDHSYTVRILAENTELLQIDRDNEFICTKAAEVAGIGPLIFRRLQDPQTLILEYIEGDTMSPTALRTPTNVKRLAKGLSQLHNARITAKNFDIVALFYFYSDRVRSRNIPVPDGFSICRDHIQAISDALNRSPLPQVLCHNDLLAQNVIDDGTRLWFIDYEYAGMNDPCFDLGNVVNEIDLDQTDTELLCKTYFGIVTPQLLSRIQLYCLMANMTWALWGCLQKATSPITYDFWSYSLDKWERARTRLTSPAFQKWLVQA